MPTTGNKSFASGEISPDLYPRTDTVKYSAGARTMRNFYVKKHGGAINRPGTTFVRESVEPASTKSARLIPFNDSSTYGSAVIELTENRATFIQLGASILTSFFVATSITKANPAVITTSAVHTISNGDIIALSSTSMVELNNRLFIASGVTGTTINLLDLNSNPVDSTSYTTAVTLTTTGGKLTTASNSYNSDDLFEISYAQNNQEMTLAHRSYAITTLLRTAGVFSAGSVTFAPSIDPPVISTATPGTAYYYVVTSIKENSFEESLISNELGAATISNIITWPAVTGAFEYNIYKRQVNSSYYGFIGTTRASPYSDYSLLPDFTYTPPIPRNPFGSSDNYPGCVSYFQQKLILASTNENPETVYTSRVNQFSNFTVRSPQLDDDAITFIIAGKNSNKVNHIVDIGELIALTTNGEWAVTSGDAGAFTPSNVNPKQYSYNGCSDTVPPLLIDNNILYVQESGSIVRDFRANGIDAYIGDDLTTYSGHLFEGKTVVDWAYQKTPNSIVWCVLDDGTLLSLTYIKNQQIIAWAQHDTDGLFKSVASINELGEDYVFFVVERIIDGVTKKFIERMDTRTADDRYYQNFTDCSKYIDGRNSTSDYMLETMTLSGGTDWDQEETLTMTSTFYQFDSSIVGSKFIIYESDGSQLLVTVTGFTSTYVVSVTVDRTVPVALRGVATQEWARAYDRLTGLSFLEGKSVSVYADGNVIASPNNPSYSEITVTDGVAVLDGWYAYIRVGLPYVSDIETLDIDILDKDKKVTEVTSHVRNTRGGFYGSQPPADDADSLIEGLDEYRPRDSSDGYYDNAQEFSGKISIRVAGNYNNNGRVFIRQIDPLPITINAVLVSGEVGGQP